jgi:hypothetical protein
MTYPYGAPDFRANDPFSDSSQAREILAQARQLISRAEIERAKAEALKGVALWCEIGGHSFSPRDRGRQEWTARVFDDELEEMVEQTRVCCSRCSRSGSITDKPRYLPAELVAQAAELEHRPAEPRKVADPEYTAYLEWWNQQPSGADTSIVAYADYLRAKGLRDIPT